MNQKDLKKIIKQLVRESLTEIFVELKLESIIESVMAKKQVSSEQSPRLSVRETLNENVSPIRAQSKINPTEKKKIIKEKLGIKDDMWANIYADTQSSGNPILEDAEAEAPDEVPASILENMGLMRDYSKHIGADKTSQSDDEEWTKRQAERAKRMSETIKRPV